MIRRTIRKTNRNKQRKRIINKREKKKEKKTKASQNEEKTTRIIIIKKKQSKPRNVNVCILYVYMQLHTFHNGADAAPQECSHPQPPPTIWSKAH